MVVVSTISKMTIDRPVTTDATGHWSRPHTFPAAATYVLRAVSTATTRDAAGTVTLSVPVS